MSAGKETLYFQCEGDPGIIPRTWKGKLRILRTGEVVEAEMEALGSYYHLILGSQAYGNFLCIPNWGVGVVIAGLEEYWWNKNRLQTYGKQELLSEQLRQYEGSIQMTKEEKKELRKWVAAGNICIFFLTI